MKQLLFIRSTWFLVFISGLVLLIATNWAMGITANPNYVPTVILLGSFLVPVTFVVYTYGRVPAGEIPWSTVAITFLWGGALGAVVAGYLEYQTAIHLPLLLAVGVGAIEESAKLLMPLVFYFRDRYCPTGDGILFGVAAGMGFAALETMGYAFVTIMAANGDIMALRGVLFMRGLLSPAGHAAWTGLVCGVLWSERQKVGRNVFNGKVFGVFALAVVLHSLWNIFGGISAVFGEQFVVLDFLGLGAVAAFSLGLLIRQMHRAGDGQRQVATGTCNIKP